MNYRNKFLVILISTVLVFYAVVGGLLGRGASDEGAYPQLAIFNEVLAKIKGSYVEDPNLSKVIHGALRGLLESLDPYSTYLTAEENARYQIRKSDVDVGLELSKEKILSYVYVIHPIEGGPSAQAGVRSGDVIESIEGVTTRNISLLQASYLLSGKVGSTVNLKILRRGQTEPVQMSVPRKKLQLPPVRSHLLEKKIGYLRVARFVGGVSDVIREKIQDLGAQGANGLVLDLRDCGGDEFDEGVKVANLFLDHGVIAYSRGQKSPKQEFVADPTKVVSTLPLVVLQNYGSASAAEIVSAAIKENHRGDIVGGRSFGKASVQKLIPLEDSSAVLLSIAKFYSQSGQIIQGKGISPDYEVTDGRVELPSSQQALSPDKDPSLRKDNDFQLKKAIELLTAPADEKRQAA